MPILIILGILLIYGIIYICENGISSDLITIILAIAMFVIPLIILSIYPILFLIILPILIIAGVVWYLVKKHKKNNQPKDNTKIEETKAENTSDSEEPTTVKNNSDDDTDVQSNVTTYIPTSEKTTLFQDKLLETCRTPDEIMEEDTKQKRQQAITEAEKAIVSIRHTLLHLSNEGEYETKNGKKYVTCVENLPYKYMQKETTNQKKVLQQQLDRMMIGNSTSRNSQLIKKYHPIIKNAPGYMTTFSISPEHTYEYEIFIETLRTMASDDGIAINPIIYNNSTKGEFGIPYTVKDNDCEGQLFSLPLGREENCSLAVKCYCEIPDKYSSDIPIEALPVGTIDQTQEVISNMELNVDTMDGHTFKSFCADLLKKNDFTDIQITQDSKDQGIDIIAYKDDIKYGIQCKCYHSNIGNKAVQEACAGKTFYNCHVGVVLTNRYFTRSAIELAKSTGVLLWDRGKLQNFINSGKHRV